MRCESRPGHGRHRGSVGSPTGASAAVLRAIRQGRGTLLLSAALLIEYEATCQLAEHRLASGLTAGEVEAFSTASSPNLSRSTKVAATASGSRRRDGIGGGGQWPRS